MSKSKKIALGILIGVAVLVLALVVAVPLLINIDRYRPEVVKHLEAETGKPVEIGKLTLHVFPSVAVYVDDFSMGNPAGFPPGVFVKARRISAMVDAGQLWDRKVAIKSLELDDPLLNILQDARGKWNFENPPAAQKASEANDQSPSSFSLGVISRVTITNAELKAANLLANGREGPEDFQGHGGKRELVEGDRRAFNEAAVVGVPRFADPGAGGGWWTSVAYAAEAAPAAQGNLTAKSLMFSDLQVTSVQSKLRLVPKPGYFRGLKFDLYDSPAAGARNTTRSGATVVPSSVSVLCIGRVSTRATVTARTGACSGADSCAPFGGAPVRPHP